MICLGEEPRDEAYATAVKKFTDTMKQRRDEAEGRLRARVGDYLAAQLELHRYPEEGFDQLLGKDDVIRTRCGVGAISCSAAAGRLIRSLLPGMRLRKFPRTILRPKRRQPCNAFRRKMAND